MLWKRQYQIERYGDTFKYICMNINKNNENVYRYVKLKNTTFISNYI